MKNDLNELVVKIKIDHIKRKKLEVPLGINVFNPNQSIDHSISNTNTQFLHSQLLIHFLLHTKLTNEQIIENKKELIELCKTEYNDNSNQLKILHEFEYNYLSSNALWWYTLDSFLYQLLTKSLNTINIDLLYLLQFFIHDLIRQLKQNQSSTIERAYRSYFLSNEEFQLFEESVGKYISINRFFSTFSNREHALNYFNDNEQDNNNLKKILFKIDADPRLMKIKPFANITVHSSTANEGEEILFSFGSIFRLETIHRGKNDLYTIHLVLCGDDSHHLKSIFDHIKHQYGENEINLLSFGNALRRMGKLDEAEKCYQRLLLDSTYDQDLISRSYHHLGRIAETKGDYDTSLEYLHQSLEIKLKLMKSNDPSIAQSYNSIGIVYQQKGDQEKALEAFNKALTIWRRAYGKSHPNVAGCYNNMGVVYKREKKYLEALESFQKALAIRERHPSANHHDLAGSHNNIGAVYERLGHHDLAIEHYNLSLKIKSKSLPAQHPSIASTFENMGYVYENRGAYLQSLSYLEKAATIYRQSLPSTHHDVLQIEQSIQRVTSKLK
jgi:tetratricopeptide (TPR) repeat protein